MAKKAVKQEQLPERKPNEFSGFELIQINEILKSLDHLRGRKFTYAVEKNQDKASAVAKHIEKVSDKRFKHKDYSKYEKARIEFCEKMCIRDENGQPVYEKNELTGKQSYTFDTNEKYNEEHEKLQALFPDYLKFYNDVISEQHKETSKLYTIDFHKVQEEDLPDDISMAERKMLKFMRYENS